MSQVSWDKFHILWYLVNTHPDKIPHDLSLIITHEVLQDEWNFETILKVIEVEARERTVESYVPNKLLWHVM